MKHRLTLVALLFASTAGAQGQSVRYETRFLVDGKVLASRVIETEVGVETVSTGGVSDGNLEIRLKPELAPTGEIISNCFVSQDGKKRFESPFRARSLPGQSAGASEISNEHSYQFDLRARIQ